MTEIIQHDTQILWLHWYVAGRPKSNGMDIAAFFRLLAAGCNGLTAIDYLWNAIFGAVGAVAAYLADTEGKVNPPRYDPCAKYVRFLIVRNCVQD